MQYLRDYQTFVGTARYWTETFAKASSLGVEEKVCAMLTSSALGISLRVMVHVSNFGSKDVTFIKWVVRCW